MMAEAETLQTTSDGPLLPPKRQSQRPPRVPSSNSAQRQQTSQRGVSQRIRPSAQVRSCSLPALEQSLRHGTRPRLRLKGELTEDQSQEV